jgi:ABC-type iron transport system FetAB permease component
MPVLDLSNLVIGLAFIFFTAVVSEKLHLNLGTPLLIATIRCTVQLTVAASVLQYLFTTKNTLAAAGITGAFLLA